jgi:hypothetical protein
LCQALNETFAAEAAAAAAAGDESETFGNRMKH